MTAALSSSLSNVRLSLVGAALAFAVVLALFGWRTERLLFGICNPCVASAGACADAGLFRYRDESRWRFECLRNLNYGVEETA
jgi:hypothetical protein